MSKDKVQFYILTDKICVLVVKLIFQV